jgi:formate C-acetyltransferase
MTAHVFFGKMLDATPDGKKSGETTDRRRDFAGPGLRQERTYGIPQKRSEAAASGVANGDQLNIRFTPTIRTGRRGHREAEESDKQPTSSSAACGQFNVVGTERLRAAQKEPLAHKDLIVLIAVFNHFVTLNQEVQNDFISEPKQSL